MSIDIERLTKKVDVDDRIDLRYYYRVADNLIRKADTYRAERKLIDLYITLVRFVSLITETIPFHKDYRLSPQSERKDFKRKFLSAMAELETLKPDVEWWFSGTCRNFSVPADRHNSSPVRETEPLVERHLEANDLSVTPLPYQVSITPSRSSHVANSAPEQALLSRTMPVPNFFNNSADEQSLVQRTMPVPNFLTDSEPEQSLVNIMPIPNFFNNSAPEQPLINRNMPVPTSSTNSASEQSLVNRIMPVPNFLTGSEPEQSLVQRTIPVLSSLTSSAPEQQLVNRIMPVPTSSTNSAPDQPLVNDTIPVPNFFYNSAPEPSWIHRTMPAPTFSRHLGSRSTGITSSRATEPDMTDMEHDELTRAIKASIETAIAEGVQINPSLVQETSTTGTIISVNDTTSDQETFDNNAYFNCSSSDASPKQVEEGRNNENGLCVVCLDSQVEAACIPCGHMAGCLECLKKIEGKSKKCPVCRANVDQVVKIYTV